MQRISCGMALFTRPSPEAMSPVRTLTSFAGLAFDRLPAAAGALRPVPQAERRRLPAGMVTLLFSDIEGSTRLLQRLGAAEYARVLGAQRRLLRAAFRARCGTEVDVAGDGSFTVFESARPAVLAAVEAQRALETHPWPVGVQVRVRMGLHTGEPALFEEGYVGLDVHLAARICAAARGGQVLLSRTTHALVEHALPAGLALRDAGPHWLKDLDRPVPLSELDHACLPPGEPAAWPAPYPCFCELLGAAYATGCDAA